MLREAVLTPAQHEEFVDQGFVFLPGLVPEDAAKAAAAALEAGERSDAEVVRACVTDRLVAVVADLLGPEYAPGLHEVQFADMARANRPDVHWSLSAIPHADMLHHSILPESWAIGAFVFLTHVRSHGGAF